MLHRSVSKRKSVLHRTARALLCLFGFVWLLFLQTSPGDGSLIATNPKASGFALKALVELPGADEFGATLEDDVELGHVGLYEISTENNSMAPALTGAPENARRARPDLSPPLVV
jgi:hypothetical protein